MPAPSDRLSARILIVDDQQSNVRLLEYALRRAGYVAVTSTIQPQEVVAMHLEHRYELMILDLQMPRMNGFEVMAALKEVEDVAPVPILVMSADPSSMLRAVECGASSFLSKPFLLADVLLRVQQMLAAAPAVEESSGTPGALHPLPDSVILRIR